VSSPKWLVVARNEYLIQTSRIRRIRPYLPYLVIGLLTVYVVFIAPRIVSYFADDFLALLLSNGATATMQVILFQIFIYFMIIPISNTLRQENTRQLEIFLAAPIKPSDVLLGEFLGQMPFNTIFATIIIGFFTALLNPLGMDIVQITIIITVFIIMFLSSLWIGTVIAAVLRTRLGKTARNRDIGRALAMIIALPLVAFFYAIQNGGLLETLADPKVSGRVQTILSLLPSSWGAEVFVGFTSNPGNIGAVGFETLTRGGGLVVFFLAVLLLGTKVANRAYSLEPITFIASKAKPDGAFYKTVKYLGGGGSFGTFVVSLFKDYGRRLENLSNIVYMMGLLLVNIFFVVPKDESLSPLYLYMIALFIFPVMIVMINGDVTVRGKENLFIFRKAPSGERRYILAMLLKGWLMALPIAGVMAAVTSALSPQTTLISLLSNTVFMMLFIAAYTAFVLGLFLLNPVFSEKSGKLGLNIVVAVVVSIGLFAISLFSLMRVGVWSVAIEGIFSVQILQTVLSWIVSIMFLYLGKRRISRIE